VYQKAFEQAVRIFEVTKRFPKRSILLVRFRCVARRGQPDEHRRSLEKEAVSRPFRQQAHRRRCRATETIIWLDFSLACGYLHRQEHAELIAGYDEIGKMLGSMISPREALLQRSKGRFMRLPAGRCQLPPASSQLTFHGDTHCTYWLSQTA